MEFKQNKFLPSEKQIVTASPDINTVSVSNAVSLSPETSSITLFVFSSLFRLNSAMMMISLFLPAMEFGENQFEKVFIFFFLQTSSFLDYTCLGSSHICRDCMTSQQLVDFIHEQMNSVSLYLRLDYSFLFLPVFPLLDSTVSLLATFRKPNSRWYVKKFSIDVWLQTLQVVKAVIT